VADSHSGFRLFDTATRGSNPSNRSIPRCPARPTVILRFWAPQATDVKLSGNWMGPKPPVALNKTDNGVWTVTVAPLEPNIYSYAFIVDGVRTTDPSCKCSFTSARRFSDSSFTVPGETPRAWESQNRPTGTLHHERFFSARQQRMRNYVVYTPPGYEAACCLEHPETRTTGPAAAAALPRSCSTI
jgi:hypothetical protein